MSKYFLQYACMLGAGFYHEVSSWFYSVLTSACVESLVGGGGGDAVTINYNYIGHVQSNKTTYTCIDLRN